MTAITKFKPTTDHHAAVRVYVESGGSLPEVVERTGMTVKQVINLMSTTWWRGQLDEYDFHAMPIETLGEHLVRESGKEALGRLGHEAFLPVADLAKISKMGMDMLKGPEAGGVNIHIGDVTQIDLSNLSPEQMRALAGGGEVIDITPDE